jgi:hypothetical protein
MIRNAIILDYGLPGLWLFKNQPNSGVLGWCERTCTSGLLLITEFINEDSPFCLTCAISRAVIGPCLRSAWFRGMLPEDVRAMSLYLRSETQYSLPRFRSARWNEWMEIKSLDKQEKGLNREI